MFAVTLPIYALGYSRRVAHGSADHSIRERLGIVF